MNTSPALRLSKLSVNNKWRIVVDNVRKQHQVQVIHCHLKKLISGAISFSIIKSMKKILRYILGTIFVMIIWAGVVVLGTVKGWLHKPIAKQNIFQSFIAAVDNEIDK